jgi:general secretion pathway protein G
MISTYQRLKRRRDAGEIDGFTLIELLIVIVVLGILAAVVIFALGGITGKSAAASCQADGATVSTALAAFNAQNPNVLANVVGATPASPSFGNTFPTTLGATQALSTTAAQALLSATTYGGPYIQSWPSNLPHYAFQLVWVQTNVGTSLTNEGTWSETLQVATGGSTSASGNLVAAGGSPASNIPGGSNAPWITYTGPSVCSTVS